MTGADLGRTRPSLARIAEVRAWMVSGSGACMARNRVCGLQTFTRGSLQSLATHTRGTLDRATSCWIVCCDGRELDSSMTISFRCDRAAVIPKALRSTVSEASAMVACRIVRVRWSPEPICTAWKPRASGASGLDLPLPGGPCRTTMRTACRRRSHSQHRGSSPPPGWPGP